MKAAFLLPEQIVREDGQGPVLDLGGSRDQTVQLTLGITRVIEQESLELTIVGSADGETWVERPLAAFPQKFYCGVYTLMLDLDEASGVRYLRAKWKVNRWGRGEPVPLFSVYVFAETVHAGPRRVTAVA
jgi:hypothetical protein